MRPKDSDYGHALGFIQVDGQIALATDSFPSLSTCQSWLTAQFSGILNRFPS